MRRRWWFARLALGTLVGGGLLATQIPDSKADCTWGVVYVTRKNAESIPVWGPGCITPETSWEWFRRETDSTSSAAVPDGTPNGYFYDVIVTAP